MTDETLHKRMVEGLLTQSEGQKLSARIAELEAENERLRKTIQDYLDGNMDEKAKLLNKAIEDGWQSCGWAKEGE